MTDKPWAWIFDLDGTLALRGKRGPYDWGRVGEDEPNYPVIHTMDMICHGIGSNPEAQVIVVSGRDAICRDETVEWLINNTPQPNSLYMRKHKDNRPDTVVKAEIYKTYIEPFYDVIAVFDDRDSVVRMWREEFGLTCFQVAEGNF